MRIAAITLASLLFACTPAYVGPGVPSGGVALTTAPVQVPPGGTVILTLSNGSPERLGCNLCTSAILSASGGPVRTDRVCTMELRTLEPGRSETYPYELPANIARGTYRFSASVEQMPSGTRTTLTSNEFSVR